MLSCFFFFNDTATTEIYTLSLHDALPISNGRAVGRDPGPTELLPCLLLGGGVRQLTHPRPHLPHEEALARTPVPEQDRKSTRLNSSHANISYAVFCLKKKKKTKTKSCSRD